MSCLVMLFGTATLIAALVLGTMGRTKFKHRIAWDLGLPSSFRRVGGLFATFFGGFLVYAAV